LFTVGKSLIGWYLGTTAASSGYGAAGALVLVLLWAYYCAQIFLFGAELTRGGRQRSHLHLTRAHPARPHNGGMMVWNLAVIGLLI
jgi:uncharacterized BrkB/YihY/UPF0761 family membrane protein